MHRSLIALLLLLLPATAWAACPATPTDCGNVTANHLTVGAGGALSGTFAGTPTMSGAWTFSAQPTFNSGFTFQNGTGGVGTLTTQANWGFLLQGRSGLVADGGLQASDGTVPLRVLTGTNLQVGFVTSISNTQTLTGANAPTRVANFANNLAGTSTVGNDNALFQIGAASDAAALTNNGTVDYLMVTANLGAGYNGSRVGVFSNIINVGATTLNNSGLSVNAFHGRVGTSVNVGGVTSGFGTTSFGVGNEFGAVLENILQAGATAYAGQVALELDMDTETGSSVSEKTGFKIVGRATSAVQGTNIDDAMQISNASGAVGWDALFAIGEYSYGWPLDPNGMILQARISHGGAAGSATGAGGVDLNQFTASGSGPTGGGFYWRSPGAQILSNAMQIGYASIGTNANGALIDATYSQMNTAAGSITVGAGGTNFTTGDLACDAYGDCVIVTATAGAVTGVSGVVSRGWQTSPPADPVAFTAMNRTGATIGSGLTLNLIGWTAKHQVQIGSASTNTLIGSGSALATSATSGMLLIPSMAGTPTGNVGALGGVALNYDSTNKKLCVTIGATVECSAAFTP